MQGVHAGHDEVKTKEELDVARVGAAVREIDSRCEVIKVVVTPFQEELDANEKHSQSNRAQQESSQRFPLAELCRPHRQGHGKAASQQNGSVDRPERNIEEPAPGLESREEQIPIHGVGGEKTSEEVDELLRTAHIFVNTSVHEGFPNTFIQAWLRDVVVVSLQVDPDHSLERRGVGIVAHSESGLVAAVRGLIDNPDVRAAYLERGRVHAIEHHSLCNADELVGLLRAYRREPSR